MPPKTSAGILLYRRRGESIEVFLVHPGGPFWARKDLGAWSIPKGELADGEEPLTAAIRELEEETGCAARGEFRALPPVRLASGKTILAWAAEGDCDADAIRSNLFELEWPPKSGTRRQFPEVDRAAWFAIDEARKRINERQVSLIDALETTR